MRAIIFLIGVAALGWVAGMELQYRLNEHARIVKIVHDEIDRTCVQDQWNDTHLGDGPDERMGEAKAMWEARR